MNKHYLVSLLTLGFALVSVAVSLVLLLKLTMLHPSTTVKYVDRVVTVAPATPSAVMQKVPVSSVK